jgi:hypothetical protein
MPVSNLYRPEQREEDERMTDALGGFRQRRRLYRFSTGVFLGEIPIDSVFII